jgi:hypothetical protein
MWPFLVFRPFLPRDGQAGRNQGQKAPCLKLRLSQSTYLCSRLIGPVLGLQVSGNRVYQDLGRRGRVPYGNGASITS